MINTQNTQAVRDVIDGAEPVSTETLPLMRTLPSELNFPDKALLGLKSAAEAIHMTVQSPYAMCASSVLAATCLAVQGHANVQLPVGKPKPLSCFFITVGVSGERKSASDDFALEAIAEKEKELKESYNLQLEAWRNEKEVWEIERKKILGNKKSNRNQKTEDLKALGSEPPEPIKPLLTFPEPTYQGLHKYLETGYPSVGLFSSEGGQFVGGHAMKEDNKMETAAGFNSMWDGTPLKRIRSGDGSSFLHGKRMAMHVMMQPDVALKLMSDRTLEDMGLTARMLVTFPRSTQGTRIWKEIAPETQAALSEYTNKLKGILNKPLPLKEDSRNELEPKTLHLSLEAKDIWIEYDRAIEKERAPNAYFSTIAGLANKLPEHAARLAGVLALYEDIETYEIKEIHMEAGIELVQYYAQEAIRLKDVNLIDKDLFNAQKLLDWIKEKGFKNVPLTDVYQLAPVRELRTAKQARNVMKILEKHGHLHIIDGGMEIGGIQRAEVWRVLS